MTPDQSGVPAAYGGPGFSPRNSSMRQEIGSIWFPCGICNETGRLRKVLMHSPGEEIENLDDADSMLMLSAPDPHRARKQHRQLVRTYRELGIEVELLDPPINPPANQMFIADVVWMTPEGAVIGRPASTVRSGEEVQVAGKVAALGIQILLSVGGTATFECADALWLNPKTVLIGCGVRTNREGAAQLGWLLERMGVRIETVNLTQAAMHLMGQLRFLDEHRVVLWRSCSDPQYGDLLKRNGFEVFDVPDEEECRGRMALNFVTVAPSEVVMPDGCPHMRSFLENLGVNCHTVEVDELAKAAGGIACLTGILKRDMPDSH